MKKAYTPPAAEVVKFEYKDQVVAASGGCIVQRGNILGSTTMECEDVIDQNNAL